MMMGENGVYLQPEVNSSYISRLQEQNKKILDEKSNESSESNLDVILQLASRNNNSEYKINPIHPNQGYVPAFLTQKTALNNNYQTSYSFNPRYLYTASDIAGYVFRPLKISVTRVPQYSLGNGVLGRTWTNTGIVEILDSLQENDFEEVLMHEILHNIYPADPEWKIRDKTKDRMWFDTKWN